MTAPTPDFPPVTLAPGPTLAPREAPPTEPPIEVPPVGRRSLWNLVIQDQAGIIQPGASVTVLLAGTSTLASLWAFDDVTPVANPATADGEGRLSVRLAAGLYDLGITVSGVGTRWLRELLATTVATQVVAAKGDLIIGSETGAPARRVIGPEGSLLIAVGGYPTWGVMPTEATVLVSDGTYPAWLPRGTAPEGSVLVLAAGVPAWGAAGLANPMTATGDLITRDAAGAAVRLAAGPAGQALTAQGAEQALVWAPAFQNPMLAPGDLIAGGAAGAPGRVAIGTATQVLTVVSGAPAWAAGMTNPMTAVGDLIKGDAAGAPGRLSVGSDGQVLKVVSGAPAWGADVGFANPMTTAGDVIKGGPAGLPERLAAGTNTQVLTMVSGAPAWATPAAAAGSALPSTNEFRLTLASGDAVPAADQTAKTTLYLAPHLGQSIMLYVAGVWVLRTSGEVSLSLSALAANTVYDIFAYDTAGAITLEALAWSSATARATALARQDGVWTKSGDPTRRYVGTIATTATAGQCEDSVSKRFVWNVQHRAPRPIRRFETAVSWTYTVQNIWRQANANAANQVEVVAGLLETPIRLSLVANGSHSVVSGRIAAAIGEDSTTTPAAAAAIAGQSAGANTRLSPHVALDAFPATVGQHTYAWLEAMSLAGTATYYNDPADLTRSGLVGEVWA
jgi:hypothetical protein